MDNLTNIIELLYEEIEKQEKKDVHINNKDYHIGIIDGMKTALYIIKTNNKYE